MIIKKIIEDAEDLYQNAPFGYLTTQVDGLIINVNTTLLGWLGYERQEVQFQKSFQDLLGIGGKIYYETHIIPLLQTHNEISEISTEIKGKDSIKHPVLINAKRFVDKQNSLPIIRYSIIVTTQRKLYELELKKAKKEAQVSFHELNEVKKELEHFAYVAAHDLKAPVRNIKSMLEIIKKKGDQLDLEKRQEYFDIIFSASDEINKMIDNLLEYSRTGITREKLEQINIQSVFEKVIEVFNHELKEIEHEIKIDFEINELQVYPIIFKRLITNLIGNAIKYRSKDNFLLYIKNKPVDDGVQFEISDNGIGIPKNQIENIFKMFLSLKPDKDSNGIGLSVCKKIVELHGGRIWVESIIGEGSTFCFKFAKNNNNMI